MMHHTLKIQASPEVIQWARNAVKEIEQEMIMLTFKFSSPTGKYNNEIRDISQIGLLTVHEQRDSMFMTELLVGVTCLKNLVSMDDSYITLKRLKVISNRFYSLVHQNQHASRARSTFARNQKSSRFLAGKVLAGILNKNMPRSVFLVSPTATPI